MTMNATHRRTLVFLLTVLVPGLFVLGGCKERTALRVVDSQTDQPIVGALIDHYVASRHNEGSTLRHTYLTDDRGMAELDNPKRVDTLYIRSRGYSVREVQVPEAAEEVLYLVPGTAQTKAWLACEEHENDNEDGDDEDDEVVTFIVPLDPS